MLFDIFLIFFLKFWYIIKYFYIKIIKNKIKIKYQKIIKKNKKLKFSLTQIFFKEENFELQIPKIVKFWEFIMQKNTSKHYQNLGINQLKKDFFIYKNDNTES